MTVEVREYRSADFPLVVALFQVAMNRGRRNLGLKPYGASASVRRAKTYIRAQLGRARGRRGFALVAEEGGRAVGFVTVQVEDHRGADGRSWKAGEIQELHVRPEARRKGIGTRLLKTAERELIRRGCAWVHVFTNPGFRVAHRFYQAGGYLRVGVMFDKRLPRTMRRPTARSAR